MVGRLRTHTASVTVPPPCSPPSPEESRHSCNPPVLLSHSQVDAVLELTAGSVVRLMLGGMTGQVRLADRQAAMLSIEQVA